MMYFGDHMSGWALMVMGFGSVLFWAALLTAIMMVARHFSGSSPLSSGKVSAEELLAQRFARGEIDAAYRQRLAVLADETEAPSWS